MGARAAARERTSSSLPCPRYTAREVGRAHYRARTREERARAPTRPSSVESTLVARRTAVEPRRTPRRGPPIGGARGLARSAAKGAEAARGQSGLPVSTQAAQSRVE